MRLSVVVALMLALPAALGLQFTAPANASTYTAPANVTFSWDQSPVTFSMTGSAPVLLNSTNRTVSLAVGTYVATITNATNASATRTVTVQAAAATQTVTVAADKPAYEVGESSRITVTVTTPEQLTLTVQRDGVLVDTYTITVQTQTDFLYALLATGTYTITVSGASSTATTAFSAVNTSISAQISATGTATVNRLTGYDATVNGGSAPYTYFWQFSDGTSSTGASVQHVWPSVGPANVTLLVQDANGKQASATKAVTVVADTYAVTVTVLGSANQLLKDATVTLTGASGGTVKQTDLFGEATFTNNSNGNYTIAVNYTDTRTNPSTPYSGQASIGVSGSDNETTVQLAVPETVARANTTVNSSTNTTVVNTTSNRTANTTTSAAANTTETVAAAALSSPEPAALAAEPPAPSAEELARAALEETRAAALNELQALRSGIANSQEKQAILSLLNKDEAYPLAQSRIEQAATQAEMAAALTTVVKDVTVLSKDTAIGGVTDELIDQALEQYFTARGITERSEQKRYEYNIDEALSETSVTTARTTARLTMQDGSAATYTIYRRDVTTPAGVSLVEFIPKTLAADASELIVDGSHDVIDADPILRFFSSPYEYAVIGQPIVPAEPIVLPVPLELVDPPGIVGFFAVKLDLGSFERGGLYLIILGIILAVVVVGNIAVRRSATSSMPAFTELAELTLSTVEQGDVSVAAKYAGELRSIHASLTPEEQAQTADIMAFLSDAAIVHEFRASSSHVHTLISLNDTTAIATAYERAMHFFEQLSEDSQRREQAAFETLNHALEAHLSAVEGPA